MIRSSPRWVPGLTTVSASDHSNDLDRWLKVKRTASVARRDVFLRSTSRASCFLRNQFSAARAGRELRFKCRKTNQSWKAPQIELNNFIKFVSMFGRIA